MCERTIAKYEEELCPTKEEKERQHQLLDVYYKKHHQVVLHRTDIQQPPHIKEKEEDPQPLHIKEEEEEVWITQEEECLLGQEEADLSKFPLTVVSVKTEEHEDKAPESSQLHHSPNVQQPPHIKEEDEDPQPPHIKEEEEEVWITQEGECLLGQEEDDVSKFPLTVVSVKTEEHEDKPPESSQLHHSPRLPGLLMKIDDLSRQATTPSARRPAVDLQIPTTSAIGQSVPSTLVQTTERLSQPPYPSTPTSHRSSPVPFRSPTVTPTQAHLQRVFDYEVDEDGQVDLGYGVAVNANNLQYVSRSDLKKTTYTVCEVVFTREELANSSLTGKKSNAFKDKHEKPKLDDKKVSAIIDFVKKLHPSSEANVIKKIIGVKLNIAQKMEKKRRPQKQILLDLSSRL
ncbi:uncharacterized protein [Nerophis lumbriciformis]|uniref:uncharacterized protein isoform X8 n=1 Tax=Nerophis lumbriciformis TaxID=546530 RepID=UPI002ADF7C7E|nr:uncharacterized protein LOC133575717 isoform X6 [Nerophis lumbriciformis]